MSDIDSCLKKGNNGLQLSGLPKLIFSFRFIGEEVASRGGLCLHREWS